MMNILKKAIICSLTIVCLSSCKDDPYAKFEYTVSCSQQMFQYAIPQVKYTDNKEQNILMELTESNWIGDGIQSDGKLYWKIPTIEFDDFSSATSEITVTYTPRQDISKDSMVNLDHELYHNLSYQITVMDENEEMHYLPERYSQTSTQVTDIGKTTEKVNLVEFIASIKDYKKFQATSNGNIKDLSE